MKLSKFLRKEIVTKALKLPRFRKLGAPPRGLKPIRRLSLEGSNSTGRISPTESLDSRGGERRGSERRGSGTSKREDRLRGADLASSKGSLGSPGGSPSK